MIVPVRPFGGAVRRNYARRRLREFFRRNRNLFPMDRDVLLRLYIAPDNWDRFFEEITGLLRNIPRGVEGDDNRGRR